MGNRGTRSISEYVVHIHAIVDSLMTIKDPIFECDQIDLILQGCPE